MKEKDILGEVARIEREESALELEAELYKRKRKAELNIKRHKRTIRQGQPFYKYLAFLKHCAKTIGKAFSHLGKGFEKPNTNKHRSKKGRRGRLRTGFEGGAWKHLELGKYEGRADPLDFSSEALGLDMFQTKKKKGARK